MSNNKYTKEQLEATRVAILREILASKGGTPRNKPKDELIKEILDEQEGLSLPERSNKGRRRLSGVEPYSPDGYAPLGLNTPKPELINDYRNVNENLSFDDGVVNVGKTELVKGALEICDGGYGFLRVNGYSDDPYLDVFVSKEAIVSLELLSGDQIEGIAVYNDGVLTLRKVVKLNGNDYEKQARINFEELNACYSNEKFNIATDGDIALKIVDLLAPIGKGQRCLIYAPEKSGKSKMLKRIISKIEKNHPETKIISLLLNRRPEEITEYKSCLKSEIISLDYSKNSKSQIKSCELVLNRAKRLVENGVDVVIALDDVTTLVKAYSHALNTVKTLGGIDVNAVLTVKQFLNSARNIENGSSLTIIACADVNAMQDELIVNELKSVCNMEMVLSPQMANRGIYPPIVPSNTYTRNANMLLKDNDRVLSRELRDADDIREIINIINNEGEL